MRTVENRWVSALLVLTVSMGMLDAIGLLHLGTFTGYFTGALILAGANLGQGHSIDTAPFFALIAALAGAVIGGRAVRRVRPRHRLISDVFFVVAALMGLAALIDFLGHGTFVRTTVAVLGFAMGLQTSASRHAAVADMAIPAATMVLHGLAHDSRLAGGAGERTWRRLGILAGLMFGATAGAVMSLYAPSLGLAICALLVCSSGVLLVGIKAE